MSPLAESQKKLDDGDKDSSLVEDNLIELATPVAKQVKDLFQPGKIPSDEEIAEQIAMAAIEITSVKATSFAGPLPPADVLKDYQDLYPEAAMQLFMQYEKEQEHRHFIDRQVLSDSRQERRRKDYIALGVSVLGVLLSGVLVLSGYGVAGAFLAGAVVLGGSAIWLGSKLIAEMKDNGGRLEVNGDDRQKTK